MLICLTKKSACLYFCLVVVASYQVTQEIPYFRERPYASSASSFPSSSGSLSKPATQRSSSKYPHLNKLMTRIDNLNDEAKNKQSYHKIRHRGWNKFTTSTTTTTTTTTTEAGLFETYGDLEDDDYLENYDEMEDDDLDYDDVDESSDEDSFADTFADIQAEEATEAPSTTTTTTTYSIPSRPVSRLTEYKWQHYGTMERVQESRRQQLNLRPSKEQQTVRAALEHYVRVFNQSKCQKPSPKVITVQHEHPDPSKTYTPHCTVLHRCAEDTGCCKRNTKCQYKSRVLVHLYFYTQFHESPETRVEKLAFYNHTECECREKKDPSESEDSTEGADLAYKTAHTFPGGGGVPLKIERCKCPKEFQRSKSITHKCACDCEDNAEDCVHLKKGKEHFSMTDRICLQEGNCGLPVCEYGVYSVLEGKCPSKKEKIDEFRRVRISY